jgi:hypothetical protein
MVTTLFQLLVCLGISAFFFIGAVKGEAFYNRWTGNEIHPRLGRPICLALGISFLGFAVKLLMRLKR